MNEAWLFYLIIAFVLLLVVGFLSWFSKPKGLRSNKFQLLYHISKFLTVAFFITSSSLSYLAQKKTESIIFFVFGCIILLISIFIFIKLKRSNYSSINE